jgi:hypothetical protein
MNTINIIDNDLGTQDDPKVTLVGSEFIPGPEGNAMISQARGYHVMRIGSELYHTHDDYLMEFVPNYCGDSAMTCELLEILGVSLMVFPVEKPARSRKFQPGFSAFYEIDNVLYATTTQPTEDDACAAALWSVLTNKSQLT